MPNPMRSELLFLKLGGSLITDKSEHEHALFERIEFLLKDLFAYKRVFPQAQILLGHGSGSFGHHAASRYDTREGVHDAQQWQGFVEVWRSARKLNQSVLELGEKAGLPLIGFPPSAGLLSRDHIVHSWNVEPIRHALEAQLIPVVYGDVVFDQLLGGTIFSTEELFFHLANKLNPDRVLLAGIEAAVFADFPTNKLPIRHIGRDDALQETLQASQHKDVTGGMRAKVSQMQALCRQTKGCQVEIFTARNPGELLLALLGQHSGTIIS